ncbi:hypothetical protein P280DRAFT_330482 [Massarina eburnea CBS 473.64]|uniref:2,3-diketo-5-methylthio-1-phosphopentane phosphatase n=1 Tax=Massarina eburnea CBS 473.64 TaxID=1395130 RepID=A0A6A6S115_9PLEO|nr:hypothetical protein P280DRAFT_330482 [Massarina eburnea CBS 473.64]
MTLLLYLFGVLVISGRSWRSTTRQKPCPRSPLVEIGVDGVEAVGPEDTAEELLCKLWKTGYENGELKTPLFEDVIPTLEAWKHVGKTLVIFSSGSVQAQLQFFSVVEDGSSTRDLKPLFAAHFDPTIAGSKLEKSSYQKICSELGQDAASVTFLTDNVKEAEAAHAADMYAVLVDRPGNAALSVEDRERFPVIERLTDIP